jgi:hypothetical protein
MGAKAKRALALGLALGAAPLAAVAEEPTVDGYDDLVRLAAMEHALFVAAGGGWVDDARATIALRWQRPTLPAGWELLPNAVGVGLWLGERADAAASLGWRLPLDAFEGPVLVADGVWAIGPDVLGVELGAGYEHRLSNRWSVVGEARGVWLEGAGVGARGELAVRMYLGDFSFIEE